jgi:fucose 4-O-acetylase-like acetyltransferase
MRKYYLDNIRYFTVINVVLFHVIYMYNGQSIPGVIGPFYKNQIQDLFQYIVYPWIMVLLFIISGMSSKYYLDKYDKSSYIHDRTVKLLVPSTIGLLVFGWAQGYYNMLLSEAFLK